MAKLSIQPLLSVVPPAGIEHNIDARTRVRWDAQMSAAHIIIEESPGRRGADLVAFWNDGYAAWHEVSVDITSHAGPLTLARLNKLVDGMNAPRVEKYHRTNDIVLRMPGQPVAVPATFKVSRPSFAAAWRVSDVHGAGQAPKPTTVNVPGGTITTSKPSPNVTTAKASASAWAAAQAAPITTMSSPPAPLPIEYGPFPSEGEPIVTPTAPTPEPTAKPEQTTFDVPADGQHECKCPPGACLFTYPAKSDAGRIVIDDVTKRVLKAAIQKHRAGNRSTVALVGPKGTGKTELVWDVAAQEGLGLFVYDGAGATSHADWVGATALTTDENGQQVTLFIHSSFLQAIRSDGPHGDELRLVLIDEVNRAELAGALNALMPILSAGRIHLPESGEVINVSHNVLFMFTMNRGSAYNATVTLDAALSDRIESWVRTDYLPSEAEATLVTERTGIDSMAATLLVRAAQQVREIANRGEVSDGISTRRVLDAADYVKAGLSAVEAAEVCWANYYPDEGGAEGERGVVLTAIKSVLV